LEGNKAGFAWKRGRNAKMEMARKKYEKNCVYNLEKKSSLCNLK
jgi:hypothetical protein